MNLKDEKGGFKAGVFDWKRQMLTLTLTYTVLNAISNHISVLSRKFHKLTNNSRVVVFSRM